MGLFASWPFRSRRGWSLFKTTLAIVLLLLVIFIIWLAFGPWIIKTAKDLIGGLSPGAAHDIVHKPPV